MKRILSAAVCFLALLACLAAGVLAADSGVSVAADKPIYGEDTMRVYMTLHNGGAAALELDGTFRLQQKLGGDMPAQSATDDSCWRCSWARTPASSPR